MWTTIKEGIWDVIQLDREEAMLLIAGLSNNMAHNKDTACLVALDKRTGRQFRFELLPEEKA